MGNRVRFIRRMLDLTQQQVAKAAGISQPYLHDIERGNRGARPETWQRIADVLGVTVKDLMEEPKKET